MKACLIAVGSEMLTPLRADTNSIAVTELLNEIGYDVRLKVVVGDDLQEVTRVFESALEWADLIVSTGGLGPTEDDLTRDAVARMLQLPFELNEDILERIRSRFARRGIVMPDNNRRQAMVPRGAEILDNPNGTAPGLWLTHGKTAIVLLPGPPREMTPMFREVVRDRLAPAAGGARLLRRVIRITGRAESEVDAKAQALYARWSALSPPIMTTILAVMGQIELHLAARARDTPAVLRSLDAAVNDLRETLGTSIYSTDERTLEMIVGELLTERHLTIATAESCTGGLLMSRLTDVPRSSNYVDRGVICYSNQAKVEMLGVPQKLIDRHGAVSEPVALAMAGGVRTLARTNAGVGITGIAGPGGGSAEKPVGMVCIAVIGDGPAHVRTFQFLGGRAMIKFQATQSALNMVRLMLLGDEAPEWAERKPPLQ